MNAHFHTPSFGDEVFDVTEIDSNTNNTFVQQQPNLQSKRMRGSMDNSTDEYHSANDESFVASSQNASLIASPTPTTTATAAARKQLSPLADPNEPAKPVSAYALFFRDTVSAIKQQNPNCAFQEISRIVASMWEALDPTHKNVYNKKNEMAKNEYIKQMRIYRQQQLEQQQQQQALLNAQAAIQTKSAAFAITHHNSDSDGQTYHQATNSSPMQQQSQQQHMQQQQSQYQQQFEQQQQHFNNNHQQQAAQLQPQQQQQQITYSINTQPVPPVQQIQLLTEAGSVQKCIRDHCTNRAIINPDWEDEYCSNECVVIHCRNVFNSWVQGNLDGRTQ